MTNERIRILVDTSRDNCWSNGLIYLEPDNLYQTTNNRDYLSRGEVTSPLQNYDVLTICSNTSLKYTDTETPADPRVCRKWRWTPFSCQHKSFRARCL